MAKQNCTYPNCRNESISLSAFCGKHTNNRTLRKSIIESDKKDLTDVFWDEVEIKNLTLHDKEFCAGIFSNIDFETVSLKSCGFYDCTFEHAVFTSSNFANCIFEKCEFIDVTLQESSFSTSKLLDCRFNEINLSDESFFSGCDLDSCDFSGGIFSETGVIQNNRFYNNTFTQVSFSRSEFENCQFIESTFSKSTLYDSRFTSCHFNTITHDFKLSGSPMLCDFSCSSFVNMTISRNFRLWNNLKLKPVEFYLITITRLLQVDHPNYLKELSLALQHLETSEDIDVSNIQLAVKSLFKRLAADAAHAGNYEIIGEILSAFGRIPERFRSSTGFFLPPAEDKAGLAPDKARLTIRAGLDLWTLNKVAAFLTLMKQMEEVLPPGSPQVIELIEKGSFIIEIIGGFKSMLAYFQALVDFKKSTYEVALKDLEIKSKDIDLEHHRQLKKIEVKKAQQEIVKNDLEIAERKLDLMVKLKEHTGYDHFAYLKTKKGIKAEKIAEAMKEEFPMLHLRLDDH